MIAIGIAAAGWLTSASPLLAIESVLTGTLSGNLDGKERIFDGDIYNFPDTSVGGDSWAGQDLGDAVFKKVTKIRYVPRDSQLSRMVGSKFQGSHTADFSSGVVTLHEVTTTPPGGWTEVSIASEMGFRYLRILVPIDSYGNVNEVEFSGDDATQDPEAPAAPTGLTVATFSDNQINLIWADNSGNEDLFLVERKQGAGDWTEIGAVAANSVAYSSTNLDPGTQYFYRVRAFNNYQVATNSAYTNEQNSTTTGVGADPKLVGALIGNLNDKERVFDNNINNFPDTDTSNSWAGQDLGEGAFKKVTKIRYVPRSGQRGRMVGSKFQGSHTADFSSGVATLHVVTSEPPDGWTDVPISNEMGFRYLRILVPDGSYGNVSEVEFYGIDANEDLAAPAAPSVLAATAVSDFQINLSWMDNSNNEDLFLIERKKGAGAWIEIGSVAADNVAFSSTGLNIGTEYSYRVRAFNNYQILGYSDYSTESSATTAGTPKSDGTAIGTVQGNVNNAFDDDTGTYFETGEAGAWVGLDFGPSVAKQITKIRFFPRLSYEGRMDGGVFEGSNSPDFSVATTLHTISSRPQSGWTEITTIASTESFRYVRFRAENNEEGGNPAEIQFFGTGNAVLPPLTIPEGALVVSGNTATLTIPTSEAGFDYLLFYSDTLAAGSWQPVTGNPKPGGGSLSWTNDITGAPKRFYRMTAE